MMRKLIVGLIVLVGTLNIANAQVLMPVKWSYEVKRLSETEGVIFLKATIDEGWHVYSQTVPDGGPVKTTFTFNPSKAYELLGDTKEPKPVTRVEKAFNGMEVGFFENNVVFQQKVKLKTPGTLTIKGSLEYMTCNDETCIPPETIQFSVDFK